MCIRDRFSTMSIYLRIFFRAETSGCKVSSLDVYKRQTLISLIFCCLSIFAVFVPAILSGKNVYCWTILTCAFIVVTNLLLSLIHI